MRSTYSNRFVAAALFDGRSNTGLTEEQIRRVAPSVYATEAHSSRSARFMPIPTFRIVEHLAAQGFVPVAVKQGGTRVAGKANYTKHIIRFRHAETGLGDNVECVPEVLLMNGNDGTSAYKIEAGAYRPVCRNGLYTADLIASFRISHSGNVIDKVATGTWGVVREIKKVVEVSDAWRKIPLQRVHMQALAEAAHVMRFDGVSEATQKAIEPSQLLAPRRYADSQRDLWTVFNVIQENCMRGGMRGTAVTRNADTGRVTATRAVTVKPVNGIDQETTLNRALWVLASKLAETV